MERSGGPLAGVRVVDIGMLIAGPMASAFLADLGADVIKIEPPKGDDVRSMGNTKNGEPLLWRVMNRGKRILAADIGTPQGAEIVRRLARDADVLVENFRPGRLSQWGLDYATLSKDNPGLVMLHMSGYGQTGPYSGRPGLGTLGEAFSGFAHLTGEPDRAPTLPGFPLADSVAAVMAAYAVSSALFARSRNGGVGDEIDISLFEPLMSLQGSPFIEYDQLGLVANRKGNRAPWGAPRNAYQTRDGRWVVLSSAAESAARRVFRAIGRDDWATDPNLGSNAQRAARVDEIDGAVADWIRARDLDEVLSTFERFDVIGGPVYDVSQIFADPHVQARGSLVELDDPVLGKVRMQATVPRFRNAPCQVRWPGPPAVGNDSRAVLAALGYSDDEVDALLAAGVVRAPD